MRKWLILLLLMVGGLIWWNQAWADDCDTGCQLANIDKQLQELQKAREQSINATKPLEGELSKLKKQLDSITAGLNKAKDDLRALEASIAEREQEFSIQYALLSERVLSYYKASRQPPAFFAIFTTGPTGNFARNLFYQQVITDRDKDMIAQISQDLVQLDSDKKKVEADRVRLAALQAKVDKEAKFFEGEIAGAKAYQSQLSQQIAALTAKQQSFLAAKLAGLNIPLFAISGGGCSSDLTNGKNPGFNGFGFFSLGVPNRVGLNQYGAWGRAKAGQGFEQILRAYYNFDSIEKKDVTINVQGYGSYSLDDYTKRIYEVPASWTDNNSAALKAQAIAIRSYALAYTDNGAGSICTTQQCQVFKPDPKTDNDNAWIKAVDETAGQAMIQGGKPIKAYFSSTHGGYVYNTGDLRGWSQTSFTKRAIDTPSGSVGGIGNLRESAYDKDSPWFYCDWGARSQYDGTAWLKAEEVADIANVILLAKKDSGAQSHLSQVDKPNPEGVDTWSADTVKEKLGGDAYSSVDNVSLGFDFGTGKTTTVTISGSGHNNSFGGDEFKNFFNLRAPANIQIVGPLYNVERRS